eukprot:m.773059 g.773059  ORF g.773059 m.773059 type:complete len:391 (-) comp23248_c0_seq60:90-1262(-)
MADIRLIHRGAQEYRRVNAVPHKFEHAFLPARTLGLRQRSSDAALIRSAAFLLPFFPAGVIFAHCRGHWTGFYGFDTSPSEAGTTTNTGGDASDWETTGRGMGRAPSGCYGFSGSSHGGDGGGTVQAARNAARKIKQASNESAAETDTFVTDGGGFTSALAPPTGVRARHFSGHYGFTSGGPSVPTTSKKTPPVAPVRRGSELSRSPKTSPSVPRRAARGPTAHAATADIGGSSVLHLTLVPSVGPADVGAKVQVAGLGHGELRYCGPDKSTTGSGALVCGVELLHPIGDHDGTVGDDLYWFGAAGHGVLVRQSCGSPLLRASSTSRAARCLSPASTKMRSACSCSPTRVACCVRVGPWHCVWSAGGQRLGRIHGQSCWRTDCSCFVGFM